MATGGYDEEIPLSDKNQDQAGDDSIGETSFTNDGFIYDTAIEDRLLNLNPPTIRPGAGIEELKAQNDKDYEIIRDREVDKFYDYFSHREDKPPSGEYIYNKFFYISEGLFYNGKKGDVLLTKKVTIGEEKVDQPVELDTIVSRAKNAGYTKRGEALAFVRYELGFGHHGLDLEKAWLPKAKEARSKLDTIQTENIPMKELPKTADQVSEIIEDLTHDVGVQTEGLNHRELLGLDKELRTIRGQIRLNEARTTEIQEEISSLGTSEDSDRLRELNDQLKGLQAQRDILNGQLKSQITRIKEVISYALHSDDTLGDKIRTIFREQGVTIASILSAFGLAVSTLVSSIVASVRAVGTSGAIKPTPKPTPAPPSKGGVTDWVKRQLQNLANVLKKLGLSALGALPGIIGSILSWIFNVASKAVGWVAEHLWTLFVGLGVLLLTYVQKG